MSITGVALEDHDLSQDFEQLNVLETDQIGVTTPSPCFADPIPEDLTTDPNCLSRETELLAYVPKTNLKRDNLKLRVNLKKEPLGKGTVSIENMAEKAGGSAPKMKIKPILKPSSGTVMYEEHTNVAPRRRCSPAGLENETRELLRNNMPSEVKAAAKNVTTPCTKNVQFLEEPSTSRARSEPRLLTIATWERSETQKLFLRIMRQLGDNPSERELVWAIANYINQKINADTYRIYKISKGSITYFKTNVKIPKGIPGSVRMFTKSEKTYLKIINDVARSGTCVRLNGSYCCDLLKLPTLSYELIKAFGINAGTILKHALFVPIHNMSDVESNSFVVEFRRDMAFNRLELDTASTISHWGSVCFYYAYTLAEKRDDETSQLVPVAKFIFSDLVSLNTLINKNLEFFQRFIDSNQTLLFRIDIKNGMECLSKFYNVDEYFVGQERNRTEIKMLEFNDAPGCVANSKDYVDTSDAYANTGYNRYVEFNDAPGCVANSKDYVDTSDAYANTGYNRKVVVPTCSQTESILFMPITVKNHMVDVVRTINKRDVLETVSRQNEKNIEMFSMFFGLALRKGKICDPIRRNEHKYRRALQVLSHNNTCKDEDVEVFLTDTEDLNINMDDYYLDPFSLPTFEKCKAIIIMFDDLFGMSNYDLPAFVRFVLTVEKNYRDVPYHNFSHGWTVAHTMYVILKNDEMNRFDKKMRLALFIASLCHDLDHRGFTNEYMLQSNAPLAEMYTTSALEHHHFNITVTILHTKGLNFMSHLDKEDNKMILEYIRYCILATDLSAAFFPNLKELNTIFNATECNSFNWTEDKHRKLAMALSMTAADLSASAKPWDVQNKTVKVVFEEFYGQGDREREEGRQPLPMMDRTKPHEQASSQVGFLRGICIPCYKMMTRIFPETEPLLHQVCKNYEKWQEIANKISMERCNNTTELGGPNCLSGAGCRQEENVQNEEESD